MILLMPCRNPRRLYTHLAFTYILRWSLKISVKRTWTGSTFSTNKSAWSVLVTGTQSRVWSGPWKEIKLERLDWLNCSTLECCSVQGNWRGSYFEISWGLLYSVVKQSGPHNGVIGFYLFIFPSIWMPPGLVQTRLLCHPRYSSVT
jgi:hypothetical protein